MEENKEKDIEDVEETSKDLENEEVDATDEVENKEQSKKEKKKEAKDKKSKLEKENEELKAELANLKNEYLKVFAEMENTKKRLNESAVKDRKYASQKVVGELVQPVDMLTQIVNMPAANDEVRNYQIGFQMIANQLVDILKNEGLALIESLGKEFDPKVMQAVSVDYNPDKPLNTVLSVMQQGYMYKDRVLRPAMVTVNTKPKEEANDDKKEEND
ncbi:MAG: nucleotide exchange factor GrpE [Acholeplasmatales bacterium]|nr:nucleotide exchange factor GrpE [Acholeplasmatales bacterium]